MIVLTILDTWCIILLGLEHAAFTQLSWCEPFGGGFDPSPQDFSYALWLKDPLDCGSVKMNLEPCCLVILCYFGHRCPKFPLIGWFNRGVCGYPELQQVNVDRWYTIPAQTYFYQKDTPLILEANHVTMFERWISLVFRTNRGSSFFSWTISQPPYTTIHQVYPMMNMIITCLFSHISHHIPILHNITS